MKNIDDKKLMKKYFEEYNLYQILTPEAIKFSELVEFDAGEEILKTGDELFSYYIFLEGRLKVYSILENGKYLLLKFYSEFDTLGDVELISGMNVSSTVITVKKSRLIKIPAEKLKKIVNDYPVFLRFSLNSVCNKLNDLSNHSAHNLLYPLKNRLASFIYVQYDGNEIILTDKYHDIAEYLGTSYRHLRREMNFLEEEKIIYKNKNKIKVLDLARLRTLAGDIY